MTFLKNELSLEIKPKPRIYR